MNLFLVILITLPLLTGCVIAIRRARPTLLFTSLGLLVYFVIVPTMTTWDDPFGQYRAGLFKAQILAIIWSALFVASAAFYHRHWAKERHGSPDAKGEVEHIHDPKTLLIAGAAATVVGLLAGVIFGALRTGSAWARQRSDVFIGQGTLTVIGSNFLLFSLVVFYLWRTNRRQPIVIYALAWVNLALVLPGFIYSGTTSAPMAFLMPFGVIWAMSGFRFSAIRVVALCFFGYAAVWFLRFMRLVGELSVGGRFSIRMSDALAIFQTSVLRPSQSFGEFFWFSRAVAYIDAGGQTMGLRPYVFALTQFIPAALWPGKAAATVAGRPDAFMKNVVLQGSVGGLIPVGMYGEAYLSYGIITFICLAIMLGLASGFVDSRYRTSLWKIPGPLICAMFCPVFITSCRGSIQYLVTGIMPIVLFAIIARVLRPLGRSETGQELLLEPAARFARHDEHLRAQQSGQ